MAIKLENCVNRAHDIGDMAHAHGINKTEKQTDNNKFQAFQCVLKGKQINA